MADPNAFPNKEQEDVDAKIDKKIKGILDNIDWKSIDQRIDTRLEGVNTKLEELGLIEPDALGDEDRSYVNTLPSDYKNKALRYLDIFRENPDLVKDYLQTLKQFGSEKKAKDAGSNNVLLYPNKISKFLKENADVFNEDTEERWNYFYKIGAHDYDIKVREDDQGRKYQKEWLGKFRTKASLGITEAGMDSTRSFSKLIAQVIDKVGPDNAKSAVDWIEANWPKADEYSYPNKLRPFDQDSAIQNLADNLTQFGIDLYMGKALIKVMGFGVAKVAPKTFKKITDYVSTGKPLKTKAGKEIADSFGNIKYASSIAQKFGYWGTAAKYGLGRSITDDEEHTTFSEGFGWMSPVDREKWNKMTKKEKAVEGFKRRLIHGAEGTVLIGGLTKAIGWTGQALWGTGKAIGSTVAGPFNTLVLNPVSNVMKSRKSGIPQLVKGIRNTGGFIGSEVLRIPPYKNWSFFNTSMGPWKERFLAGLDEKVLTPLRVRGPWTKEAKQIIQQGEQRVRALKKDVGISLSRLDRSIYGLLNKGFASKAFTSSSVGAGKQHWDDVIRYLKGEVKIDALPQVLREPARDIQQLIEKLSKQIKPYVKSEEIKKEIIDGMGKYLTTSYKIFQGSFKPDQAKMAAATQYFVGQLKKVNPKYKNVKEGHKLWPELNRLASQKVDEILQFGKEGSSPIARLNAIRSLVTPDKILKDKQALPKVIEDLMGKVDNPMQIIMDTVSNQAELLSHLFTHKSILREGLRSGWIVTDPKKFAMEGVQKWVSKSLVPIQTIARASNIDIAKIYTPTTKTGAGNFFTTPQIAQAIASDALATDVFLQWGPWKAMVAAKTTAQLSKTVLSLMTQARNFETAMFFSVMQGHIGTNASVLEAMKFVFGDVIGKGKVNPIAMRKKMTEWADVGILDTSIVGGEVEAVIGDIIKSKYASTDQLFKALMKNPVFSKATEFYQGSDTVWKVYGYEFTKSQLLAAIPLRGLTVENAKRLGYVVEKGRTVDYNWKDLVANQFREVFGMRWNPLKIDGVEKSYGDGLKEIAGKYIKDTYPNYNIVPNLVKNWRRLPVGNFIAFRSENIRNVYNTMAYSMREMSSSNPFLRQMGAKRMLGLGATLYGLEKGLRVFTKGLTNIDEEWLKKYQRWFSPYYDKTSTLFPMSKVDPITKKFWTLNWTREQPYEGVQDAFAEMFKELFNPIDDDTAMGKRFFNAFFYNFEEEKPGGLFLMFEPFVTPSLLIEAIRDIAPAEWTGGFGNSGVTNKGKIVYDIRNDSMGEILAKMFGHLFLDVNPTTVKHAKDVMDAAEGDLSRSGREMNTLNKVMKMILGLGLEEQDPIGSIPFTVGKFTGRIIKTRDDFYNDLKDVNDLIKDPFLVPKEFDNWQANRYREMNRVYDFVMYLKNDLNLSNVEIMRHFKDRGGFGKQTIGMLLRGKFDAANLPPTEWTSRFPQILKRINRTDKYKDNPLVLKDIYDREELMNIKSKWMRVPMGLNDKQLEHYFMTGEVLEEEVKEEIIDDTSMRMPPVNMTEQKQVASVKPQVPLNAANVSSEVIASKPDQNTVGSTGLTAAETAYLSNEEKAMKLKQTGRA